MAPGRHERPPDLEPDLAYEALVIQQDTRKRLIPLLPERTAPSLAALRDVVAAVYAVVAVATAALTRV